MEIRSLSLVILCALLHLFSQAQSNLVVAELEDGDIGNEWNTETSGDVTYVTISTNGTQTHPERAERIITLQITFQATGTYDLYARINVGPAGADDDSFFNGNGFGTKSPTSEADWIRVNNLNSVGYTSPDAIVGGSGNAGSNIWKWINLSEFMGDEIPIAFDVQETASPLILQIGAREDGLLLDKIAFAPADQPVTVAALDGMEIEETEPIAEGKPKFLGCAHSNAQAPFFTNYWNQVTPENAGKWGSVERTRGVMNWSGLDAAYQLAKDNGYLYRHHVLIWGNQQPSWIENLPANEQLEEIREWFQAVAERYPDIDFLEVVNEPIHDPPNSPGNGGGNYINALGGTGSTGFDWIIEAFRMARQYFPNAKLAINDYNIVNSNPNTNKYLAIINGLMAENLVDVIGVQAHAFSTTASNAVMASNLDKLAATGLPIHVTEMDIDGPTDQEQLDEYQRIFPLFWEHPAVEGITLWGYRVGLWRTDQMAYLVDEDGVTERPALQWLRQYVSETLLSSASVMDDPEVRIFPNPVSDGKVRITGIQKMDRIMVFDNNGQVTRSFNPVGNAIDLQDIPPGIYYVRIEAGNQVFVEKLVVTGR